MIWTPWSDARVRAAAGFGGLCAALTLAALVGASRDAADVASPPLQLPSATVPALTRSATSSDALAALAPFGPSRPASASSQSMAGDTAIPPITCVGTIAGSEQPAAICRLALASPRILHAGDTLGGWRLVSVAPGRVVFIDAASRRREFRLSSPGS